MVQVQVLGVFILLIHSGNFLGAAQLGTIKGPPTNQGVLNDFGETSHD